jgi:hypothetical protein
VLAIRLEFTENVVTFPTARLLYPVTNDTKLLTGDTSKKYPVAPETEVQLALNETSVTLDAAETAGAGINVNPAKVPVPPGVVTETVPDVPDATTAVILVGETTKNDVAAVPPKLTAVAPTKLVPVMVTVAPLPALVGVNEVTVGGI